MRENEDNLEIVDVTFTEDEARIGMGEEKEIFPVKIEIEDSQEEEMRDTSFKSYNQEQIDKTKKKKKSFMAKFKKVCTRTMGIIIMIPILMIAITIGIAIIGGGFITGLGLMGAGLIGAVATAFIATAQPGLLAWLGFFLVLGTLSGAALIMCIVILLTRKVKELIIKLKKQRVTEQQEA